MAKERRTRQELQEELDDLRETLEDIRDQLDEALGVEPADDDEGEDF